MNEVDRQATERVMKARAALILARRFYGVLVSNVEPVASRQFPTMATNSVQHFFNPDFIMKLTQDEVEGVQAHETEHDARHHSTRRGGRDPKKWNEACDYAINIDLIDEGFTLPAGVLIDERFRGMSAEDIYRTRELDEERNKPQPQPPQDQDDDEPKDDESDDDESNDQNGDDESDDQDDDTNDDTSDDKSDESDDESNDDQDGESDGDADDSENDEQSDDTGNGDGETDDDEGDDDGEGTGEGTGTSDDDAGNEGEPQSSGDPGQCGEVLDAPADKADDLDHQWERIVRQAASMAKAAGQMPGHISRDIERANNPAQDWREVLRAWFDQGALITETWNRPNRRLIGGGLYLPGHQRDGINRAAMLIDTSGSMDEVALAMINDETQAALDDGVIDELVVIYGDTQVTRVDIYKTGDVIEFDPRGGGGTILKPLFDHVRENFDDVSLIVCFSDMENNVWGDEPSCPVLFAATGYPQRVRELLANAPWGAPGIDVGAH